MPVDSILVSAAVVSVFVIFAGVLIWANFQTDRRGESRPTATEGAAASDQAVPGDRSAGSV